MASIDKYIYMYMYIYIYIYIHIYIYIYIYKMSVELSFERFYTLMMPSLSAWVSSNFSKDIALCNTLQHTATHCSIVVIWMILENIADFWAILCIQLSFNFFLLAVVICMTFEKLCSHFSRYTAVTQFTVTFYVLMCIYALHSYMYIYRNHVASLVTVH